MIDLHTLTTIIETSENRRILLLGAPAIFAEIENEINKVPAVGMAENNGILGVKRVVKRRHLR